MYRIFTVLLFVLPYWVAAQNPKADSLRLSLKDVGMDTVRVEVYSELGESLRRYDRKASMAYLDSAVQLSRELGYVRGEVSALSDMAFLFATSAQFDKAIAVLDRADSLNTVLQSEDLAIDLLNHRGIAYTVHGEGERALPYFLQSHELVLQTGDTSRITVSYNSLGNVYGRLNNQEQMLRAYLSGLAISESLTDPSRRIAILMNLEDHYMYIGQYAKALEYINEVKPLIIESEGKRSSRYASALYHSGKVYKYLQEFDNAVPFFREAVQVFDQINDDYRQAVVSRELADSYNSLQVKDSALYYYRASLSSYVEYGNSCNVTLLYGSLGRYFAQARQLDSAFYYLEMAQAKSEACQLELQVLNEEAAIYEILDQPGLALAAYQKAYDLALERGNFEKQRDFALHVAEMYEALRQYQDALTYRKAYQAINDTLADREAFQQLAAVEAENAVAQEMQKLETDKELLVLDNAVQRAELANRTRLLFTALGGVAIVFMIAMLIYRQYRQKQKSNAELASKNEEISSQAEELRIQSEELLATNNRLVELDQFKEAMTGMVAHDLKNPLNNIMATTPTNAPAYQYAQQMLHLTLNMLDVQKYESTELVVDATSVLAQEIARMAQSQVRFLADQKNLTIRIVAEADVWIAGEQTLLVRVLVNLLTNAIKYSPNNATVTIAMADMGDGMAMVSVEDQGEGIPDDQLGAIFHKYGQVMARDSGGVRSTGLGLTFCKLVAESHGGTLTVSSTLGMGSVFSLRLPTAEAGEYSAAVEEAQSEVLTLSMDDIQVLRAKAEAVKSISLFQAYDIEQELEGVAQSLAAKQWVNAVMDAAYMNNLPRFEELIGQVTNQEQS